MEANIPQGNLYLYWAQITLNNMKLRAGLGSSLPSETFLVNATLFPFHVPNLKSTSSCISLSTAPLWMGAVNNKLVFVFPAVHAVLLNSLIKQECISKHCWSASMKHVVQDKYLHIRTLFKAIRQRGQSVVGFFKTAQANALRVSWWNQGNWIVPPFAGLKQAFFYLSH